ncbi:unnamed protein product [Sphagnum jensenii]|uniref:Uncharacterized protein n=1 Tax=Sphagnum jensenii TaxID=128206 RepID=A0ABP0WKW4_9BRYO
MEALAPGEELPGISPELDNNKVRSVTMNSRKESITKPSSSASAAFESLNAASRFGLSVRVSNQRKSEPTNSENTPRRDTGLDGGSNPQAHVSDVVSSYGGNIVSGRWALANRGMLDQQRTKTSKQSTTQIQAQSLEMEAVHLTSEESTPGADFHQSDHFDENQPLALTPQRSSPVIKYRICTV